MGYQLKKDYMSKIVRFLIAFVSFLWPYFTFSVNTHLIQDVQAFEQNLKKTSLKNIEQEFLFFKKSEKYFEQLEKQKKYEEAYKLCVFRAKRWDKLGSLPDKEWAYVWYIHAFYQWYFFHDIQATRRLIFQKNKIRDFQFVDKSWTLYSRILVEDGSYQEAIEWCTKGIDKVNPKSDIEVYLGLLTNLMNAKVKLNAPIEEITEVGEKLRKASINYKDKMFYFYVFTNLGEYYYRNQNFAKAREYYSQGVAVRLKYNLENLEADNMLASCFQKQGNYQASTNQYDELIKLFEKNSFVAYEKSKYYLHQADNFRQQKELGKSEIYIQKAAKALGYQSVVDTYEGKKSELLYWFDYRIRLSSEYGNLKKIQYFQLQADTLIDRMRKEHTEINSKLFWRENTHHFYEKAIEVSFKLKDVEKAFYFIEKSRAILLLDALKDLEANGHLPFEVKAKKQKIQFEIEAMKEQLSKLNAKSRIYQQINLKLLASKDQLNNLIDSTEKANPAYQKLKYNHHYISLEELQEKLKDNDQSFLEYFVGNEAVYAISVTSSQVRLKKIALKSYLDAVNVYQKQLLTCKNTATKKEFNHLKKISYALYKHIFEPFQLPKGRVIVSHDNYFVSMASLLPDWRVSEFLIKDYRFSYAYSANVFFKNINRVNIGRTKLLGVAPVNFDEKLGVAKLYNSDHTLESIEKNYFTGKLLTYHKASKANFKKDIADYDIIQLFTHGKADSTESTIYFQDSVFSLNELQRLPQLQANLVVLSACQTNIGKNATGEGVMSFARGFANLDVPSTVSTLWSVDNNATYQITELFYKYLSDGYEKDIALQKAQIDYLKKPLNPNLPFYWSGIVLIGDSGKVVLFSKIWQYTIIGVGCLLFGLLAILAYKKLF